MITFGRLANVKDKEEEKKIFLYHLNTLISSLSGGNKKKYKEMEIIKPLKKN